MAIDEKRLNVERRSSKDRRSGVDTRSEKEKGSVGKGARQLTVDRGAKVAQAAHHPPSETRVGGTFSLWLLKQPLSLMLMQLACSVAVALQGVDRGSLPQSETGHSRFL